MKKIIETVSLIVILSLVGMSPSLAQNDTVRNRHAFWEITYASSVWASKYQPPEDGCGGNSDHKSFSYCFNFGIGFENEHGEWMFSTGIGLIENCYTQGRANHFGGDSEVRSTKTCLFNPMINVVYRWNFAKSLWLTTGTGINCEHWLFEEGLHSVVWHDNGSDAVSWTWDKVSWVFPIRASFGVEYSLRKVDIILQSEYRFTMIDKDVWNTEPARFFLVGWGTGARALRRHELCLSLGLRYNL